MWTRRLEVLLAQVAYVVQAAQGGKMTFRDFDLFSPAPKPSVAELIASDEATLVKRVIKKQRRGDPPRAKRVIRKGGNG